VPGGEGEILAVCDVADHPVFARRGRDLTVRLPVTLAEAALGAVVTVATLHGAVAIRVPHGTPHGRILRVKGRGIGTDAEPGDLLVTVEIVVPVGLNDTQRAALQAFAAATESPRAHLEALNTDARRDRSGS
jgi:molecular chaperone DnaJ